MSRLAPFAPLALILGLLAPGAFASDATELLRRIESAREKEAITELGRALAKAATALDLAPLGESLLALGPPSPLLVEKAQAILRAITATASSQAETNLARHLSFADPLVAREIALELIHSFTPKESGGDWVLAYFRVLRSPSSTLERRLALLDALVDPDARRLLSELPLLFAEESTDAVRARILDVLFDTRHAHGPALCREALADDQTGDLCMKSAVRGLVREGDQPAILRFLELQATGSYDCAALARTCGAFAGLRRVTEPQRQLLLVLLERDICEDAQVGVITAVGLARESRAGEHLTRLARSDQPRVVVAAVRALLALATEEELEPLLDRFSRHALPGVQLAVAEIRLERDDVAAVKVLTDFMVDLDEALAKPALEALVAHKLRETIPALIASLANSDTVRRLRYRDALQAHLDCFFPYYTPRTEAFVLDENSTPDTRATAVQVLQAWFKNQR